MKFKSVISVLVVAIILVFPLLSFAQDSSDYDSIGGAQYYFDGYDERGTTYSTSVEDTETPPEDPEKERGYVSDQAFNNAMATKEKYGMTWKQRRALKKKRKQEQTIEEQKTKVTPLNPTPHALLRLPVSIMANNRSIPPGFYLLEYKFVDDKEQVVVKERDRVILTVVPREVKKQTTKIFESYAAVINATENDIEIELNTKYSRILFNLPKGKS